jgi:uncharacterized protein (TIGR04168 family)
MSANIAVIGDVHLAFNQRDVQWFNASGYDLLLFVGDLAQYTGRGGRRISRILGQLTKPGLVIPGNHDNEQAIEWLTKSLSDSFMEVGGYSVHGFSFKAMDFDVIVARPHSNGGSGLHMTRTLSKKWNVQTMEDSVERLKRCVDATKSEHLVFLCHNGPAGLGDRPEDIWGCDFLAEMCDYGDLDLQMTIAYARSIGKSVRLVVGGHMHLGLRGGGIREWHRVEHGVTYVNAAEVPRIRPVPGGWEHAHVSIHLDQEQVHAAREKVAMHSS